MAKRRETPRIDLELGERIENFKRDGGRVRGLDAFLTVHHDCASGQTLDDRLPKDLNKTARSIRANRQKAIKLLRTTVASLRKAGHDPDALFKSLGIASPTAFARLDDARLSR